MKNLIMMRRRNMIVLENGTLNNLTESNERQIATVLKNIESLGYTVSKNIYDVLLTFTEKELLSFYREVTSIIENLTGSNFIYDPMYPNFPTEVMEKSDAELYLNAFVHYLTNGKLYPNIEKNKRLPLFDEIKVKVIDLGADEDFFAIMQNIMESKTSISETDKSDLAWFFEHYQANVFMPDIIPMKENAAYICKLYLEHTSKPDFQVIYKYIKTATDVLRLATAMSGGDISLSENTKFISFSRSIRRLFLSILNSANNLEEDMKRYKNKWIKVGERLHPFEYTRYSKTVEAFKKLRNNEKIETFNGQVENYLINKDYYSAFNILKTRAGEFARKLDYLLRTVDNKNLVINSFLQVVNSVSTTVLLQVKNHFEHRNDVNPYRVFFPKGNLANAKLIENNLPKIPEKYCKIIVKICENALIAEYQKRDFLGSVYLSEEFKNYYVPFNQRSASNSMRTVVRGSKLPLDANTNTIRAFIHWHNMNTENDIWDGNRVDIDLSAVLYDENWNYIEHISYTNLRSQKYNACHSGDITDAPEGACEFIDFDLESVKQYGGRYIVFTVNNFTGQTYNNVPECFMGWMERQEPNSGEIFEAATVKNRIDLTANTMISIPMIIDVVNSKTIWTDVALKSNPNFNVNIENNQGGIVATCMALTNMQKTTLYDLISLHIKARGLNVTNPVDADIVFDMAAPDEKNEDTVYIDPFMLDVFMSEYL